MSVESFSGPIPPYPSGTIMLWSAAVSDIPRGWVICDGNNGTPNLLNRFPKGVATASTDPGTTGGQNSLSLSPSNLPSHSHSGSVSGTAGSHNHVVDYQYEAEGGDSESDGRNSDNTSGVKSVGNHSHNINLQSAGGGSNIDNQPKHTELVFIQKT